jgi:hypothetical protein
MGVVPAGGQGVVREKSPGVVVGRDDAGEAGSTVLDGR